MPRIATRNGSDLAIRALKAKLGQKHPAKYPVGGEPRGLYIQVTPAGTKAWLLRVTVGVKLNDKGQAVQIRREFGLGSYPKVSLQSAREKALAYLAILDKGEDPVIQRLRARAAIADAMARRRTFAQVEREAIKAKGPGFKNPARSVAGWRTRMDTHVLPVIGHRDINELVADDIAGMLEPLWRTKYPTARKILHDVSSVFRYAKAKKVYERENPAKIEVLGPLLGKPSHREKHFPSLPYIELERFIADLQSRQGDSAFALELLILTAARSDEVRSAPWSEFDLDRKIWTIPAIRMKRDRDHRVPLSERSIEILKQQRKNKKDFPFTNRDGEPLTDAALSGLIKKMHERSISRGGAGYFDPISQRIAVPHGFRSSFKDWARSRTTFADEVSELALAHVNSDSTRAAYARDELLELRRSLMDQWSDFCVRQAVITR